MLSATQTEELIVAVYNSGLLTGRIKNVEIYLEFNCISAEFDSTIMSWEGIVGTGDGWDKIFTGVEIGWSSVRYIRLEKGCELKCNNQALTRRQLESYLVGQVNTLRLSSKTLQSFDNLAHHCFKTYNSRFSFKTKEQITNIPSRVIIGPSHLCPGKVLPALDYTAEVLTPSPAIRIWPNDIYHVKQPLETNQFTCELPETHTNHLYQSPVDVIGYVGCPVFHNLSIDLINQAYYFGCDQVVWMVPDFRINNVDIEILRKNYKELKTTSNMKTEDDNFTQLLTDGRFASIDKDKMNCSNDSFMVDYGKIIIENILNIHPDLKLLFWCAFKRYAHLNNKNFSNVAVSRNIHENTNNSDVYSRMHTHIYRELYPELVRIFAKNTIDIRQAVTSLEYFDEVLTIDSGGHPSREGYELIINLLNI